MDIVSGDKNMDRPADLSRRCDGLMRCVTQPAILEFGDE
jgi:hypothetical protein